MVRDEVGRLRVDHGVDDVVQGLVDDRLTWSTSQPAHSSAGRAHPLHLVVVGADEQVDELGVAALRSTARRLSRPRL